MNDGNDNKQMLLGSLTTASKQPIIPDNSRAGQTGTFAESLVMNGSCSEMSYQLKQ